MLNPIGSHGTKSCQKCVRHSTSDGITGFLRGRDIHPFGANAREGGSTCRGENLMVSPPWKLYQSYPQKNEKNISHKFNSSEFKYSYFPRLFNRLIIITGNFRQTTTTIQLFNISSISSSFLQLKRTKVNCRNRWKTFELVCPKARNLSNNLLNRCVIGMQLKTTLSGR